MRKILRRVSAIICAVLIVCISFVACSKEQVLKKKAKDLNTYTIDLKLNDDDMTVQGIERLEYKNRTETIIDKLVFHLYPTAFSEDARIKPYSSLSEARCFPNGVSYGDIKINSVKVNGENSEFSIIGEDDDKLEIKLINPLDILDSVNIEIDFSLTIPNCTHRFGYYNDNINLANFYPILAVRENGEYDMTPYYSIGDPFYSECANYNVSITYPEKYKVFSSGNKKDTFSSDGLLTSKFTALAVRDFAFVLGKNFEEKTIEINETKVTYVGYCGDSNIDELANLSAKCVEWMSEKFSLYPYKELYVVKTPFVHGGMEYPSLVMISDTIEEEEQLKKVISHEIAHEWWYGLVGVNETKSAWIDEGLSEYTTALFFDDNPEYNITYKSIIDDAVSCYILYVDVISSINGKINTKMNIPVNEYLNDYEYTYMIYIKGTIMFDELSKVVGKNKIIHALSNISKKYAFGNMSDDEFIEGMKRYTRIDADNFFEGFLSGGAIIGKLH